MNALFFDHCRVAVLSGEKTAYGIGTLSEKTVHSVLKQYLSEDASQQEIKIGTYFADVFTGERIFEIQTRAFNRLRNKLALFLEQYPVTVVYPLTHYNYLRWVSPVSGEISKPKKSSRIGNPLTVFAELYKIRPFLTHPHFSLKILWMDTEEYRMLDGYGNDKKRRATKCDKFPMKLCEEMDFLRPEDYMMLIPPTLPEPFTAKTFAKEAKINHSLADTALLLLTELCVVQRIGKQGNAFLYTLCEFHNQQSEQI